MKNSALWLRVADVAPLLGVSRGRVYQLVAGGDLPAVRRGRCILIPRAAWQAWLDEQAARALSATAIGVGNES